MKKIILSLSFLFMSFVVFSQTPWTLTTVHRSLPVADAGSDQTIAIGGSIQIGTPAVGGNTYGWTSDPVGFTSTDAQPIVNPVASTYYYLVVDNGTCFAYDTVRVNVTGTPLAFTSNAVNPGTVCSGTESILSVVPEGGTGVYTFSWNIVGDPTVLSINDTLIVAPTSLVVNTFRYNITLSDGVTTINDTLDLVVNPLPVADAGSDQTIAIGGSIQIGTPAVGGNTYGWTSDPVGFTSTDAQPIVNPVASTYYYLVVDNGTCFAYDTVRVNVTGTPLAFTSNAVNPGTVCSGTESILSVVPEGGTGVYTFSWNIVGDPTVLSINDTLIVAPTSLVVNTFRYNITLSDGVTTINDTLDLIVNPLPLNQIPTVNVPVVADTATVCGLTTEIVIGLQATQSNYIYELYDADTDEIVDTVTSPALPVDGAIQFAPQFVDRTFGIRVWDSTRTCFLIVHN
ncbi:MAG: hypothetical protein PHR61_04690 [Candidatus Absconditabacteria bacterium]|nr:hypothetical protein [Candidatus Absconditabacteria bacterium]